MEETEMLLADDLFELPNGKYVEMNTYFYLIGRLVTKKIEHDMIFGSESDPAFDAEMNELTHDIGAQLEIVTAYATDGTKVTYYRFGTLPDDFNEWIYRDKE